MKDSNRVNRSALISIAPMIPFRVIDSELFPALNEAIQNENVSLIRNPVPLLTSFISVANSLPSDVVSEETLGRLDESFAEFVASHLSSDRPAVRRSLEITKAYLRMKNSSHELDNQILEIFKEGIQRSNGDGLEEFLEALPTRIDGHNKSELLKRIYSEIAYVYRSAFHPPSSMYITLLEKFSKGGWKNPQFYNSILNDILDHFNEFNNHEVVSILDSMSRAKIDEPVLINRIARKLARGYSGGFTRTVIALGNLGITDSDKVQDLIISLAKHGRMAGGIGAAIQTLTSLLILGLDDASVYKMVVDSLNESVANDANLQLFKSLDFIHAYDMISAKFPEISFDAKISAIANESREANKVHIESQDLHYNDRVTDLLEAMNVTVERRTFLEGKNFCEIYLPETNQAILAHATKTLNFNKQTVSGKGVFKRRILENLPQQVGIIEFNRSDLYNYGSVEEQVQFLEELGIKNNNTSGVYTLDSAASSESEETEDDMPDTVDEIEETASFDDAPIDNVVTDEEVDDGSTKTE